MQLAGFAQLPLVVRKHHKGLSSYGLRRKAALLVNAITSFSNKPLIFIFHVGWIVTVLSLLYAAFILTKKLIWGIGVPGWATTIISISLFSGVIILFQGIIGIYIAKVYVETKKRPYTTVRAVYEHKTPVHTS
jgi:putative glycosyltransferase